MFIDRHDLPGVTAAQLAAAHRQDVEIQDRHQVQYHTYWFDPTSGAVFCLAEGPSKEAINAVHNESHGLTASAILELDLNAPLNEFFGVLPSVPLGTEFSEPALRIIAFTDMRCSVAQTHELGDDGHMALLGEHNRIVRDHLVAHEGREVKHTGDGIMAAFTSAAAAVLFAVAVQRTLESRNNEADAPIHIGIGISAGEPVTDENGDLFGAAVQLAARLCSTASSGEISVSLLVRELCIGKNLRFVELGKRDLKGFPEPVEAFSVAWRA